ncbi:MAG: energy-coupling factor ABC transporter permease [Candidatus Competibacteraceae bacterium]
MALGLRALSPERLPQAGLLSAAFFVASLIHVPIGLSSTHLVLNSLLGVVLGWAAFPALLIALLCRRCCSASAVYWCWV